MAVGVVLLIEEFGRFAGKIACADDLSYSISFARSPLVLTHGKI